MTGALSSYFSGAGLGASLTVAIGAQNTFVLRQGLKRRHVGIVVAICACIDVTLIALGVGGMGALVRRAPVLLDVIRWAGAAFVFLYGLRAFIAAWRGPGHLNALDSDSQTAMSAATTVLALSLLNPHVYLVRSCCSAASARNAAGRATRGSRRARCARRSSGSRRSATARFLEPWFEKDVSWRVLDVIVGCMMWWIAATLVFA